jgi:hypothetical protein
MLGERLQGLLLILVGCASMVLIYFAQQAGWFQQARPPTPPGIRPEFLPVITPLSCVLPMAALGALGLCFIGFKRLVAPDDWNPPKHLDAGDVSRETFPTPAAPRPSGLAVWLRRLLRRLIERSR